MGAGKEGAPTGFSYPIDVLKLLPIKLLRSIEAIAV
jgi:hypothetical protein